MDDPVPSSASEEVARLLDGVRAGESGASEELLPLVYGDLRRLASARMARLGPGQTLQATELVHEAYLRLAGDADPGWQGRAHFLGIAARAMRDILADHLQRKGSLKRGGHFRRVGEQTAAELSSDGPSDDILALEEVLQQFGAEYPRKAEVVTLSFFGGLTAEEIAGLQGTSSRTVERDLQFAKAWLNSRLAEHEDEG